MGLFSSMNIASSGLTAQRLRLDVISDNIANANTTRTTEGGPYRRSRVIFSPRTQKPDWKSHFLPKALESDIGKGVRVVKIEKDMREKLRPVYDPTHPDANEEGYYYLPNVDEAKEIIDLMATTRSYEANLTIYDEMKNMAARALTIGR